MAPPVPMKSCAKAQLPYWRTAFLIKDGDIVWMSALHPLQRVVGQHAAIELVALLKPAPSVGFQGGIVHRARLLVCRSPLDNRPRYAVRICIPPNCKKSLCEHKWCAHLGVERA